MRIFTKSIRIGWEYLTHPYKTTNELIKEQTTSKYSWTFLIFSLVMWTFATGYQNLIVGETSRARELYLDIILGTDFLITVLTIPLGILTVVAISFLVTKTIVLLGGNSNYTDIFKILAFTLNIGSTFFDLQYEIGVTLTGHAWKLHEVPNFIYYAILIMGAPIVWSLIITFMSLSHYSKLGLFKTILAFLIGVLPLFALLIFIVM